MWADSLLSFMLLLGQAVISLFVIMDPIGAVPFFTSLTSPLTDEEKRRTAKMTPFVAALLLLAFALAGSYILIFLGITLADFQIAGGIFLIAFAVRDAIVGEPVGVSTKDPARAIPVFPLATPLLAGPGSITTVMLISQTSYGFILAALAIVLNCTLAWLLFKFSGVFTRILKKSGLTIIAKLMDIIMGSIGVAYILIGLQSVIALLH